MANRPNKVKPGTRDTCLYTSSTTTAAGGLTVKLTFKLTVKLTVRLAVKLAVKLTAKLTVKLTVKPGHAIG